MDNYKNQRKGEYEAVNEDELKEAFEARIPMLKALGEWVCQAVIDSLSERMKDDFNEETFFKIPPKYRVKCVDSFLEKAMVRKPKEDPLTEITDQVGVRFVVLSLHDVDVVGNEIEKGPWSYEKDKDFEKDRLDFPEHFSYQSNHYVVRTKESVEFEGLVLPVGAACEVQVRTLLQHAHAEISHSADYKPSLRLPREKNFRIKRSLAKGSALIETTDEVFRHIFDEFAAHDKHLNELMHISADKYVEITGFREVAVSRVGMLFTDSFRDTFENLESSSFSTWVDQNRSALASIREKRGESVFFRNPIVFLLAWLVTKRQVKAADDWPIDQTYREELMTIMGYSPHIGS